MSIENGERFIRLMKSDPELRERVKGEGWKRFGEVSAKAGASCTTYEVVAALIREIEAEG
jgi:hypothetical protein